MPMKPIIKRLKIKTSEKNNISYQKSLDEEGFEPPIPKKEF